VTLWLLSAVFFVLPLTIAAAGLVAKYPGAGGLCLWTRHDFGPWHGFLCSWSYWMGITFLFPTAALLYMKVAFSLLGPAYANIGNNRYYLLAAASVRFQHDWHEDRQVDGKPRRAGYLGRWCIGW
jgi:amino acid transporter